MSKESGRILAQSRREISRLLSAWIADCVIDGKPSHEKTVTLCWLLGIVYAKSRTPTEGSMILNLSNAIFMERIEAVIDLQGEWAQLRHDWNKRRRG